MEANMVMDMDMATKQSSRTAVKKWYVIYTTPRSEKQVNQKLQDEQIKTYLPLHLSPRRWSDRIKMVEMPLFPSYLFIHTYHHKLYDIVKMPGVVRIIYFEGKPTEIREKEINAIIKFLEYANGKACKIELDDEVRIAVGALKDTVGKVIKIKKKYVVLLLKDLGLQAQVMLDGVVKV
ncbi:MAG: hypothetical protein BGO29_00880 [Bacteroidales bacterium 36-12]|nr:MAG: hypothetical protein BGO29_00880 [Bacteroidales bacterium 36-12]